jgi:hypothetical protein
MMRSRHLCNKKQLPLSGFQPTANDAIKKLKPFRMAAVWALTNGE